MAVRRRTLRAFVIALWVSVAATPLSGETRICLSAPWTAPAEEPGAQVAALVGSLAPALARYPEIAAAMTALAPDICLQTPLRDLVGCLDPSRPRITLCGDAPDGILWGALLHELRHLDQFARGLARTIP